MGIKSKKNLELSSRHKSLLSNELTKRTLAYHYHYRISIVLRSFAGESQASISRDLGIDYESVRLWRTRWIDNYSKLMAYEEGMGGKGVKDQELLAKMLEFLSDKPRSGAPRTITTTQEKLLTALACESPSDYGLIRTNWTHATLAQKAIEEGIFEKISPRYVGVLLKKE